MKCLNQIVQYDFKSRKCMKDYLKEECLFCDNEICYRVEPSKDVWSKIPTLKYACMLPFTIINLVTKQ